jgi:putative membrane protein
MMDNEHILKAVIQSVVFSGVGLAVFVAGFFVLKLLLPYDIHKEIETDQNVALGVVVAGFIVGLAIIVAAAIHG